MVSNMVSNRWFEAEHKRRPANRPSCFEAGCSNGMWTRALHKPFGHTSPAEGEVCPITNPQYPQFVKSL